MHFQKEKVKEAVIKGWSWAIHDDFEVILVNSMANVLLKTINGKYHRICPEELSCYIFAHCEEEAFKKFNDNGCKQDWQLLGMIDLLEEHYGSLNEDECYTMTVPAVIGGQYELENMDIGNLYKYIIHTGKLAKQIERLIDGETVELDMIDYK